MLRRFCFMRLLFRRARQRPFSACSSGRESALTFRTETNERTHVRCYIPLPFRGRCSESVSAVFGLLVVFATLCAGWLRAAEEEVAAPPPNPTVSLLLRLKDADLSSNAPLRETLTRTLDATRGTPDFLELVRAFKLKDRDAELMTTAMAHSSNSTGAESIRLVLEHGSVGEIRKALAGPDVERALEALGNLGERSANEFITPVILDPKRTAATRGAAIRAAVKTREGASWLLKLAQDQFLPDELKPIAARELADVRWPEIKEPASKVLPPPEAKSADPLPPLEELLGREGDASLGERVFFESGAACYRCHQIRGKGVEFGPNLSEIGDKYGKDGMYAAVLTPSAGIGFGFEAWQVEFKNGDEAFGLITSETEDEVTMKAVGGIVTRYKKATITRRVQQETSIMPEGLGQGIGAQALVNLIEYLTTLKKPAE